MERVSVLVRIQSPGILASFQPPPDKHAPSAHWMEKLASLLRPLGEEVNTFRCVLFGSLQEVASHLWQHQVLWMRMLRAEPSGDGGSGEGAERHVAVSFSELIEPGADFSSRRYVNAVSLEEEALDGSGEVTVEIVLEAIRDDVGLPASILQPSLTQAFLLHLQLAKGSSSLIARAVREAGPGGRGLSLRCGGVEQPLQDSMDYTLVLVSSWDEVPRALVELDVCVQAPMEASRDFVELPLDLSGLQEAAGARSGSDSVSATALSAELPSVREGLTFTASVCSFYWSAQHGRLENGRSKDSEQLWTEGLAEGPRSWRVSIEVRSVRLTSCTANAFVVYAYELLQQPRPFRTNPATLARRNSTVYLPHSFAAYTLTATTEDLQARLEDPLRAEVWHRDVYKKDTLIGVAEFGLGAVFDRPVQYSATMPSMVCGFRVLDQACSIIGTAEPSPGKIGALRLLLFVEDLGPASEAAATAPLSGKAGNSPRPIASFVPSASIHAHGPHRDDAGSGLTPAAGGAHGEPSPTQNGAASLLKAGAEYATAFELELWKRAEEEKFRSSLKEQEAAMREQLEEEYRQREVSRAKEFRQKQSDLRDVEAKVRKKLQELQQREVVLVAEEARVESLRWEMKRRTDLAVQDHKDASHRLAAEAQLNLRLEQERGRHLEARVTELEAELTSSRKRFKELEFDVDERRRRLDETPTAKLQQELQSTQLLLHEARQRAEAMAASRDHFKGKVEELCLRLLGSASSAPQPTVGADLPVPEARGQGMAGVTTALHRIQDSLSDLARDWGATPGPVMPVQVAPSAHGLPSAWPGPAALPVEAPVSMVAASQATSGGASSKHVAWLRGQKEELLQSGLYSEGDPVLLAIDARIREALRISG
mmetsp:Transcript_75635/g.130992  ORF Transcript_75635/g.130992 Transcript_75635/m.130992 type:complete len:881 (-) Transcript_75635:40-2682(-)